MNYDFTDPLVLHMVDLNHAPTERQVVVGASHKVRCEECLQPWPCEARQALRQYEEDQTAKTIQEFKDMFASSKSLRWPW